MAVLYKKNNKKTKQTKNNRNMQYNMKIQHEIIHVDGIILGTQRVTFLHIVYDITENTAMFSWIGFYFMVDH